MQLAGTSKGALSSIGNAITKRQPHAVTTQMVQQRHYTPDADRDRKNRVLQQQLKRDWKVGDLYAPHDLSAAEMRKWGKKQRPTQDVFDILAIDPLSLYKNFSVMSDFVSDMGRIRPASETGLRPVNQRKVAKAVRRAQALGLMPSVHKHPEVLRYKKDSKGLY